MDSEFQSLIDNGTWTVVPAPANRKFISSRWVYDLKTDADGNVARQKARFVARGFSQIPGIDFYDIYVPVATAESTRILLHLGLSMGLEVRMLHFKTTFLNGNLEEEIYLEQAKGYEVQSRKTYVYKLHNALYGLVQAARS